MSIKDVLCNFYRKWLTREKVNISSEASKKKEEKKIRKLYVANNIMRLIKGGDEASVSKRG